MTLLALAVSLLVPTAQPPAPGAPAAKAQVISTGQEITLARFLAPEQPTVFVFTRPASTMERAFVEDLAARSRGRIGLRTIQLGTGSEPAARQYDVKETPTAIIFDRRGRQVARTADSAEIDAAVRKALGVARIDWPEPGEARYEEARRVLGGRPQIPDILRTMSLQPEYMRSINELSQRAHFSDGFLNRRTKEMIATYVSALNKCKY